MRLLLSILAIFSLGLQAKRYGYHEGAPFHLGAGLNPLDINETYNSCLTYSGEIGTAGQGTNQVSVVLRSINSREELFKELGISVEVTAQSYFANGKASSSYLDQIDFFEDGLTWIVVGKVDYGHFKMYDPQLKPKYQTMLKANRHAEFAAACGTEYFAGEQRGSSIFAIYSLRNLSTKQKTQIEALLGASVNFGKTFSADLEAEFKQLLRHASRSSQMEFRAFALGGGGLTELANLATDAADITKVQQIIRNYMKTMTPENAVPVAYTTGKMEQFGYQETSPFDAVLRDRVLGQYYFYISEASQISVRLYQLLGRVSRKKNHISAEQIAEYRELYDELVEELGTAHEAADRCYRDARECKSPRLTLPLVDWPTVDENPVAELKSRVTDRARPEGLKRHPLNPTGRECEAVRVAALESACINEREYFDLKAIEAMPLCNSETGLISWSFCEQ